MTLAVEALVFDLGGVIVAHDNALMHRRVASRCGAAASPGRVAEVTGDAHWGTGRPIADLHDELQREAGYEGDWATFRDDFTCHLVIDASMLAFVEQLAGHRRVMIFSNTNQVHWDFLVCELGGRLGALERHLSHEIGHAKPSLRSFEVVAETSRLTPGAMLFFDDVAVNVEGARRAGLQAEVFTGERPLRELLAQKGLMPGS